MPITESYVNLVPTVRGGTHVNGLRQGLADAVREFCEFRNLLPRGVKLAPEDVWECCAYLLSVKLEEPQFSGQTKERLTSRACAAFVSGVVRDAFTLWLHQHVETGERIAALAIEHAQRRLKAEQKVVRKKITGGSAKQARDKEFQAVMPLRGKIEYLGSGSWPGPWFPGST